MDNLLKKISSLGTTMSEYFFSSKSGGSAIGIDIGSESIKLVQLKNKNGKAVLETYGSVALGPYMKDGEIGQVTNLPKEKIVEALVAIMREAGTTTKVSALSIQSAMSLVFVIELPPGVQEKNLPEIIPNEARKYIPVPISEVSLDWWVIPKREEFLEEYESDIPEQQNQSRGGKMEVLVVAIHNESIAKYQDIIKDTALDSSFFEIEMFSSVRSLLDHELSLVLLIDVGASKTKISMVEYGIVKNFHIINRGSADITLAISKSLEIPFSKAENIKREFGLLGDQVDKEIPNIINSSLDFIFNEANNVVLNYEKKYNKAVSKIIISGGGSLLKGFIEKAEENFRAPVFMGEPFSKVEAPAFLSEVLKSIGPEFAIATGLALKRLES